MPRSDASTTRCANCGLPAGPRYCPHCGQEVVGRFGRPLLQAARELLSDWLSLDGRLVASLRALAVPGRLSELYTSGKRAPFLRPFRLYLLMSVALFSTVLTLDAPQVENLRIQLGGVVVQSEDPDAKVFRSLSFLDTGRPMGRWMAELSGEHLERAQQLPIQELVELLFHGLRRTLPTTLILFVPFLAAGLKLLYIRGRAAHHLYLDHLVFALHYQSAVFAILTLVWLVAHLGGFDLLGQAILYAVGAGSMLFVYLPWALRRFYRQSRWWTAVKAFLVLNLYGQLLGLAVDLSVVVGIRGA